MRVSVGFDHVFHQTQPAIPLETENGLRMELYGFYWQLTVPDAHDNAVFRLGGDFEAGRKAIAIGV